MLSTGKVELYRKPEVFKIKRDKKGIVLNIQHLLDQFVGHVNAAGNEGKGFLGRFRKTNIKEGFLAASIK